MKQITSIQNPFVKQLVQLQDKAKARRETGTFLIEGKREIELAVKGGFGLQTILVARDIYGDGPILNPLQAELIEISREVYEKLAYRESTEGILAVAGTRPTALEDLNLPENPLILIAESPEKPGNIGALLRTADAAGIDAVIIADPKSDLYNPNIIRSSVGALFTTQTATGTTAQILEFLKARNIALFSACLQDSKPYTAQDFKQACAIAVGTEATGLTTPWRKAARQNILIPMRGEIDSMNVSVAAAVLLFEAVRQRNT